MNYAPANLAVRPRHLLARFDVVLAVTTLALGAVGLVMIYSATRGKLTLAGLDPHYYLKRQAAFMVIGVVAMVALALFDYRRLEQFSTVLYVGIVLALVAVLATPAHQGSQRWFSLGPLQLQPSEFATLVLDRRHRHLLLAKTRGPRLPRPGADGADVGAAHRAGHQAARPRHGHPHGGHPDGDAGGGGHARALPPPALRRRRWPWCSSPSRSGLLQHYQIERLTSFISPNGASQSATYNVTQAKDAIAVGGVFGQGLFHGALTNLSYVPSQQTDFIFSAVGEQVGFVGLGDPAPRSTG